MPIAITIKCPDCKTLESVKLYEDQQPLEFSFSCSNCAKPTFGYHFSIEVRQRAKEEA